MGGGGGGGRREEAQGPTNGLNYCYCPAKKLQFEDHLLGAPRRLEDPPSSPKREAASWALPPDSTGSGSSEYDGRAGSNREGCAAAGPA